MRGFRETIGEMEHGADFAGGAAGDIEEGEEFGGGAAFEAFGDVVGDGERGAADLAAQVAGLGIELVSSVGIDFLGEFEGGFPDGQIFETIIFHEGISEI